jgi:hypothetical protein
MIPARDSSQDPRDLAQRRSGNLPAGKGANARSAYRFTLVPRAGQVREYVAAQLTRPGLTPFAQVRLQDGRAVGCTSYCTPRLYPERPGWYATEIGWTWLAASAQRTGINAEAKLLLMTYRRPARRDCCAIRPCSR